ncbi:IS1595 family transposase [Ralstonia pickettii]|jgi:transposase|nr:IS1595 family transposase [Ralstonia insidiosa]MBX3773627.1 IS1595 family transposase [Ralstonia pickettii]NOZ16389.1 IS1595 family transposase [Betaproteobacteria bacterium]MBA9857592.1 IS1595 family transposase [Ralstonia insidiosa]MBA9870923.1 IS1595 family transposase [Ralstonia insidiosa]MBA9914467.1 IS1595 family transposase [Ralstonia insidiosa]
MKRCPECGYTRAYQLGDGRRKCQRCGHRYRWRSAWDASRLSGRVKHELLQRFVWGVPVYRQRFGSTVSRPAIERFYRLIRACMAAQEQLREPFTGALECDETTFGGARHGKRGWGAAGKVVVFGIVKRNGEVKAAPIAQHDQAAIMEQIQAHTREGSLYYYTDAWQAYATLRLRGDHVVVRKEKGRPVGRDHINGIEGFWSYAKNWLYPYRGVPRKHFHLYLGEVCWRFNHRDQDLKPLLLKLLQATALSDIEPVLVQIR